MVLEADGTLDTLENLQSHPNHNIYAQALKIIEEYFNDDDP